MMNQFSKDLDECQSSARGTQKPVTKQKGVVLAPLNSRELLKHLS